MDSSNGFILLNCEVDTSIHISLSCVGMCDGLTMHLSGMKICEPSEQMYIFTTLSLRVIYPIYFIFREASFCMKTEAASDMGPAGGNCNTS